jgi:hypothetical protein
MTSSIPEPNQKLLEFMKYESSSLFRELMNFLDKLILKMPDDPALNSVVTSSVVSAAVAYVLAYRYQDLSLEDQIHSACIFCDSVLKNFESMSRIGLKTIFGDDDEVDKD